MAKIFATHDVTDVDTWLSFKAERAGAFSGMGGSQVQDHVAQDGSNSVAISAQVDDVDAVMAAMASPPPELADAMQRHGVIPPVRVYVER
ncbi:MAG: hypothetical protein ACHQFZ_06085 [Acidimicrobiales bacterium]